MVRKDNISTIFLLPCLGIRDDLRTRDKFKQYGFINTYMFSAQGDYNFYPLYLLFKPEKFSIEFYRFTISLEKSANYIETIDKAGSVVLVFKIPDKYARDYRIFLDGKYSELSDLFKNCFPMKVFIKDKKGKVLLDAGQRPMTEYSDYYHIFNRTEHLIEIYRKELGEDTELPYELYEKYHLDEEILEL